MDTSFQYAKGRFVNPKRIIDTAVYSKQSDSPDSEGHYPINWRVALTLDVANKDKGTLYSDAFSTEQAALEFCSKIPLS